MLEPVIARFPMISLEPISAADTVEFTKKVNSSKEELRSTGSFKLAAREMAK
ncbi:MAG: hypothetical protein K8S15_06380 [Candidatus Aegiribacteria sp.]|nr:hypothetical protein [Candidatus Aegiribacteria sp.]